MTQRLSWCLIILLCFNCNSKRFTDKDDLLAYLNDDDNGYVQHKSVNGVDYTLSYRPTDMLVNQELDDNANQEQINKLRDKYSKYMYFNLSMSMNNKELLSAAPKNRNEFSAMVNQLAFGMSDKVHLYTQSKDTLELADFIYPRMYGMSKSTTIMFVYPREEALQEETIHFTIEDLGMYTGEVKFKIPVETITNEPTLTF